MKMLLSPSSLARPLLALAVLAVATTLAQGAAIRPLSPQEDNPAAQRDERTRELNRILHLSGGGVARGKSRWTGETWELRRQGAWQALPPGSVARVRLEREVEAQARQLAREVGRDDHTRRVALADWMLREGLAEEALRELDRVLQREPDQPSAVALLARPPVPLRVSLLAADDAERLLRDAAGAPPAVRELALHKLATLEPADALRARLGAGLQSHSSRLRALSALALRRLFPGEEVRGLVVRSVLDGSEEVRREAALSLRAVENEAVILPAVRALSSSSTPVRENAIQALATMGYPSAVPALIGHLATVSAIQSGGDARPPRSHIFVGRQFAYIQDFDVEVAQGAAIADPIVNTLTEGSVLDVRVIGVNVVQSAAVEARAVRRSLSALVGEEHSTKGWLEWWQAHQGDFVPATPPLTPAGPGTSGG